VSRLRIRAALFRFDVVGDAVGAQFLDQFRRSLVDEAGFIRFFVLSLTSSALPLFLKLDGLHVRRAAAPGRRASGSCAGDGWSKPGLTSLTGQEASKTTMGSGTRRSEETAHWRDPVSPGAVGRAGRQCSSVPGARLFLGRCEVSRGPRSGSSSGFSTARTAGCGGAPRGPARSRRRSGPGSRNRRSCGQVNLAPLRLVSSAPDLQRARVARAQIAHQVLKREPRVDDVLENQPRRGLRSPRPGSLRMRTTSRGVGRRAVGGDGHEVHLDGDLDEAHQIGHEEHAPFSTPTSSSDRPGVVAGDLLPSLGHAALQVIGADEHLSDSAIDERARGAGHRTSLDGLLRQRRGPCARRAA